MQRVRLYTCLALLAAAVACEAATRPKAGPAERVIPQHNPTPRDWSVIGPFTRPLKAETGPEIVDIDFLAPVGGEAKVRPPVLAKAVARPSGGPAVWKRVRRRGDVVDLDRHLGGTGERAAYAFTTVRADRSRVACLMYAATGARKAWVNGDLVMRLWNKNTFDKRDSIFPIRLRQGTNQILLKLTAGSRGLKFSLTFADPWQAWLYHRSDYSRGALRLSLKPGPAANTVELAVQPPRWVAGPPKTKGLTTVFDETGRVLSSAHRDLRQPTLLRLPRPGIYGVQVVARYDGPGSRCGVRYVVVGNVAKQMDALRTRVLRWLDGRGQDDVRHRGCVLWLAEAAWTRGWRSEIKKLRGAFELVRLRRLLGRLEKGEDVLAAKRGTFLWAFRSSAGRSGQPMCISLPDGFDVTKRYPLVVFLHGSGATHYTEAFRSAPADEPYIQISGDWRGPWCRDYSGLAERDVKDAIAFVNTHFKIDSDRIYLFGHSIGSFASWRHGSLYPSRFAALAPYAGSSRGYVLSNLTNVPVQAHHGTEDRAVYYVCSAYSVRRLQALGGQAELRSYAGQGHWVYGAAGDAVRWLLTQRRSALPRSVDFTTRWVSRGRGVSYWLRIMALTDPHRQARVRLTAGENRLVGTVQNVRALSVHSLRKLFLPKRKLHLEINGHPKVIPAPLPATLSLRFRTGGRFGVVPSATARAEPAYSEGSIQNLYDGKPVRIVVPSGGTADYRAAVRAAAGWLSRSGGRYGGLPIVEDREVDPAKPNGHLIVLGSAQSNSCLKRLADLLPIKEANGSLAVPGLGTYELKDRGYAFYYHHPKQVAYRLVLFSSARADYFKNLFAALPDSVFFWRESTDAAPDFVLRDVARNRYLRVAGLGNDWRFGTEYASSPRLRPELADPKAFYRCMGEAIRDVSGADFAFTRFQKNIRIDPGTMRAADLACLARAVWGFGIVDGMVVTPDAKATEYIVRRLHDPKKYGTSYDPFGLWPWPAKDWSARKKKWTVCLLGHEVITFGHVTRGTYVDSAHPLKGVHPVSGDFLGALLRRASRPDK